MLLRRYRAIVLTKHFLVIYGWAVLKASGPHGRNEITLGDWRVNQEVKLNSNLRQPVRLRTDVTCDANELQ